MLARERHDLILRHLALRGSVQLSELMTVLGVSEITVRRDLTQLAAAGLLTRTHGGAIAVERGPRPAPATALVGVVVPSSTAYFPSIIEGAQAEARRRNVRLVMSVSHYKHDKERDSVRRLVELGVRGILLTTADDEADDDATEWLASIPVPVVMVERPLPDRNLLSRHDHVSTDHVYGAFAALRHFAALGHTSVGFALNDVTPTAHWLSLGYDQAVERLGLDPAAPRVALPRIREFDEVDARLNAFLDECSAAGTRAVFVHTDMHGGRLVEIAVERGLRVPEDLAVISYDDEVAALSYVPLTAVSPPKRRVGAEAVTMLMNRLDAAPGEEWSPHDLRLLPQLVVRASCGADPDRAAEAAANG